MKKIVIFDFDGTLAETLTINLQIVKDLNLSHGREITDKILNQFRDLTATDFLRQNKISKLKLFLYSRRIKKELGNRMDRVNIFPGMKEEIGKMHKAGYRMGILSSNDRRNIDLFLEKYKIANFFDFIYTEKNIFSKDVKLQFIMQFLKLKYEDVLYVGDEARDIEAAKKVGLKNIAVTWGYNSIKILKKTGPDALVEKPKQLIKTIESL